MNIEEKNGGFITVLRWIAVIPGGTILAYLSVFPLHWFLYLSRGEFLGFIEVSPEDLRSIERFLSPILISIVFVYAGARIAPTKQFATSVALFIIRNLFMLSLFTYVAIVLGLSLDSSLYGIVRAGLSAVAGLFGVYLIYKDKKPNRVENC